MNDQAPSGTSESNADKIARIKKEGIQTGTKSDPGTKTPEGNKEVADQETIKGAVTKPKPTLADLHTDGSKSPHDVSSEGGSRQAAAHKQLRDAAAKEDTEKTNPAFQAAAKARSI